MKFTREGWKNVARAIEGAIALGVLAALLEESGFPIVVLTAATGGIVAAEMGIRWSPFGAEYYDTREKPIGKETKH